MAGWLGNIRLRSGNVGQLSFSSRLSLTAVGVCRYQKSAWQCRDDAALGTRKAGASRGTRGEGVPRKK